MSPWRNARLRVSLLIEQQRRGDREGRRELGVSAAGRPRLNVRLMVSLWYLKNAFNLGDQALCDRRSENGGVAAPQRDAP